MLDKVRSLVAVLALALPGVAAAQPSKRGPDPITTFLQQDKYSYCDVKMLSALWKVSIEDGKSNVGLKLQTKNEAYLTRQLSDARAAARKNAAARCSFSEAGFTYQDAKTLAKLWRKTEAGAKALAEDKIAGGAEKYLRELLKKPGATPPAADPLSAFLAQDKYSYCDVKLLSALWKASLTDTKTTIGMKLQAKNEAYLESELGIARKKTRTRCSWVDAGLTYNDVEQIARAWKISVGQAKVKIGQKVTANGTGFIREMLGGPDTEQQADLDAYFAQSKYRYCDAALIGAMWKQSVTEGKAFIGLKLRTKNPAAIDRTLADARVAAQKHPVQGCAVKATKKPLPPPRR